MKSPINPRLANTVKRRRETKAALAAFNACAKALENFTPEAQKTAMRAYWAMLT